jgi:hypothetical protein
MSRAPDIGCRPLTSPGGRHNLTRLCLVALVASLVMLPCVWLLTEPAETPGQTAVPLNYG